MILFSLILQDARGDLVIRQVIEHRCLRADSTQSKSSCSILVRGPSNIHTNTTAVLLIWSPVNCKLPLSQA